MNLEHLWVSPAAFGVTTASPTQRAVCRVIEGLPLGELACDGEVMESFGGEQALALLPLTAPTEVDLLAGIRTGKSRLAACVALQASQIVDVAHLAPGEIPRVTIVSLSLDSAQVVLDHLVGTMQARPALRGLMIGEPSADGIMVRHPSGRPIEIAVAAGRRAGGELVSRWSAGAIFDEFTRMFGSSDGAVVNYDDARRAVIGRLLPRAQVLSIGSPWAPMGPAYERCQERHGKPGADLVVVRAKAPALNPVWWTAERCAALQQQDPTAYATDVMAEFADPSSAWLSAAAIKRCTRAPGTPAITRWTPARAFAFAMDPGTRGNSWTLVGLAAAYDREGIAKIEVVVHREWQGSPGAPLDSFVVLREIGKLMAPYETDTVHSDQYAGDPLRDIGSRAGVRVIVTSVNASNRFALYDDLGTVINAGQMELPPDPRFAADLLSVRRQVTQTGIRFALPVSADKRHADYVPALALALHAFGPLTNQATVKANLARRDEMIESAAIAMGMADVRPPAKVRDVVDRRWRMSMFAPKETSNDEVG